MAKIVPYILFVLLVLSTVSQAAPLFANRNAERLDRFVRRVNPLRYPSAVQSQRNYYPVSPEEEEAEPETFYVKMNVESEEDLETKYVNVFIDTKRNRS